MTQTVNDTATQETATPQAGATDHSAADLVKAVTERDEVRDTSRQQAVIPPAALAVAGGLIVVAVVVAVVVARGKR